MEQENFINSILNSTNGLVKVAPGEKLFSKIEFRIRNQNAVSQKIIWLAAASIALLISLNIALLSRKSNTEEKSTAILERSIYKSNQLY